MGSGVHVGTKMLLHFFLNGDGIGETEVGSRLIGSDIRALGILCTERDRIEQHIALGFVGNEADLCHVAFRGTHFERRGEKGHLDLIGAIAM